MAILMRFRSANRSWWQRLCHCVQGAYRRWRVRPARQLRVCENLPLGERRFLSIVEFEKQKFLVGGGGGALAMLARLSGPDRRPEREEEEFPTWEFVNGAMVRSDAKPRL